MPRYMYGMLLGLPWILWIIYWAVSARGAKTTVRRESLGSRVIYILLFVVGAVLCLRRPGGPHPEESYLSPELILPAYWTGLALIVLGLGFSVWARRHLGANWSGTVTVKENHELIRSGPYGWTRHPIYTGLLFAMIGVAVAQGQWRGIIGFALFVAGLMMKMRIEERFMTDTFGEAYTRYRAEVPELIPWV
jgi:protein-S-isoprenylcysteine O-methyltransferase Ste14